MSVYVDGLQTHGPAAYHGRLTAQASRVGAKNGHRWCHLVADSEEELLAFARRVGMRREWLQGGSLPHFDLTPRRRADAVRLGAIEISARELCAMIRRYRARKASS